MGQEKNSIGIMNDVQEVVLILAKSISFRKKFHSAIRKSSETPEEWLCRVKSLAEACSFGESYNVFVLDKFLTGLEAESIDHLCSNAEYLDINSSLQIIHENEVKSETVLVEALDVVNEQPETVCKQTMKLSKQ